MTVTEFLELFERMSVNQKAHYVFTDEQWKALNKGQRNRVFFARKKVKEQRSQ